MNSNKIDVKKKVKASNGCSNNTVEKQNRGYRKIQGQLCGNHMLSYLVQPRT